MREKVLLVGEMNTSKTLSLVTLAIENPNSKVVIFDPDDGISKLLIELGIEDLENLIVLPVDRDWSKFISTYEVVKTQLGEGDWLCFDMLGKLWDLVQQYYSKYVFGESPIQHLMTLKGQAKSTAFGGFEGLTDWPLIKRLHNEQLIDDAILWGKFNIMATTSTATAIKIGSSKSGETEGIYLKEFGIKPEGEKHNIYRFDSQCFMFRTKENKYRFRIVRDRGRTVDVKQEFDITGRNFWSVYKEYRGL